MDGISRSRGWDKEIPHCVLLMEQLVLSDKWARNEYPYLGITICHHLSIFMMLNCDPQDGFFYPTLTFTIYFYIPCKDYSYFMCDRSFLKFAYIYIHVSNKDMWPIPSLNIQSFRYVVCDQRMPCGDFTCM